MEEIKFNPEAYRGKKYATHVIGLDNLLRDGIVLPPKHVENSANGTVILIKGKPGTGKTTLGLQFLIGLTKSFFLNNDESITKKIIDNSVFFSVEQEKEELEDKLMDIEISRIFEDYKNKTFSKAPASDESRTLGLRCNLIHDFFGISPTDENDTDNLNLFFKILTYNSFDNSIMFSILRNDSYIDYILKNINKLDGQNEKTRHERLNRLNKIFIDKFFEYKTLFEHIITTVHALDASKHYIEKFLKQKAEEFQHMNDPAKTIDKGLHDDYNKTIEFGNLIDQHGLFSYDLKGDKEIKDILKDLSPNSHEYLISLIKVLLFIYSVRIVRNKINKEETKISEKLEKILDTWQIEQKLTKPETIENLISEIKIKLKELSDNNNEINYDNFLNLIRLKFYKKHDTKEIEKELRNFFSELTRDQAISKLQLYIKSNDKVTKSADAAYSFSPVQKVLDFIKEIEENDIEEEAKLTSAEGKEKEKEQEKVNKYYPCVVLDGLNILTDQEKKVLNLNHIIKTLKKKVFFSILVYDGNTDHDLYQDYLADMVIELRGEEKIQPVHYFLHDLQITKSRFQSAAYGWHQYKIREFGLQVYKSVHFHLHINKYMDNQLSDSFEAIKYNPVKPNSDKKYELNIENILNSPIPGSFTVILGPRATFKTSLTLNFLYSTEFIKDSNEKEGDSLLVSVVDNLGTLHHACQCPTCVLTLDDDSRAKRHCAICHKHFYIFHLRPGCISPDEFFHYLECRVKEHKNTSKKDITRIAFWDLTQLEYRFPLFLSDSMFLPGLIGFGKKNKIAMIVMGAGNSALTPAASAVADNVIFTWRDERKLVNKETSPVLAVYVDRCEGKLGQEGKELTYIDITEGKQAFQLNCPGSASNQVFKDCTKNESELIYAKDMIQNITEMQGMGGVKRSKPDEEPESLESIVTKG